MVADRLVVLAQLAHETQQGALGLVADLLGEFAGHFGGDDLRRVVGVDADPEDQELGQVGGEDFVGRERSGQRRKR